MTRVKRGSVAIKRRKKIIKLAKGFRGSHSRLFTAANQQTMKSLQYSYFDRRKKKNDFKRIWIARINGFSKIRGTSYSNLINKMKKKNILLNKKILSEIILKDSYTFDKLYNTLQTVTHK